MRIVGRGWGYVLVNMRPFFLVLRNVGRHLPAILSKGGGQEAL